MNWCQQMTYRKPSKLYALFLARSPFTQRDLEKSKIALASYGQPFLPKLSSCYCALHFPTVPCHGGSTKKPEFVPLPTFEMLPRHCPYLSYTAIQPVYDDYRS